MDITQKFRNLLQITKKPITPVLEVIHPWESTLRQNHVFVGLSHAQLHQLIPLFEEIRYHAGDKIVAEGEQSRDFYVIYRGSVEVVKIIDSNQTSHVLTTLKEGDCFGEMSMLNDNPRSATVRTAEPTTLLKISATALDELAAHENSTYAILATNLARDLASRLRMTNELTVESLRKELALTKSRVATGSFIVYILTLFSVYVLCSQLLTLISGSTAATTFLTAPLIVVYSVAFFIMMKRSGYPLSYYGFNLNNWRATLQQTLIWTSVFCIVLTLIKWLLINHLPLFKGIPLLDITAVINPNHSLQNNIITITTTFLLYTATAPLQEMIFRGAMQSSLQDFLSGKYATLWAILLSSMLFSIAHLHVTIWFALLVFVPSLFWGTLYARQKSLLGVCVSHILIGWWILYGLGFERFVHILMANT